MLGDLCGLFHFPSLPCFPSYDTCSGTAIIFLLRRKSIPWGYRSLFSDCFPWEQDSCHSKRVTGFCFSEECGKEGFFQRSRGLRANSCSSISSHHFLSHHAGSYVGLKKTHISFPWRSALPPLGECLPAGRKGVLHSQVSPGGVRCGCSKDGGACGLPTGQGLLFSLLFQKQKKWEEWVHL